jgi:DNA-binding GntR family transcriptional regulator
MITHIERNRVRSYIMEELLKGSLTIGGRLSLPVLARQLDCSVTPVREALTQLEYSRVIEAVPNRGFIIPGLDVAEATHLYELIAALEALAVEKTVFTAAEVKNLRKLQKAFEKPGNAAAKIKADMDFHEALTANYENPFAQQTIRDLKIRIFFYEQQYMGNAALSDASAAQHGQIVDAAESNDSKKAAKLIKLNWLMMLDYIQKNFAQQKSKTRF